MEKITCLAVIVYVFRLVAPSALKISYLYVSFFFMVFKSFVDIGFIKGNTSRRRRIKMRINFMIS